MSEEERLSNIKNKLNTKEMRKQFMIWNKEKLQLRREIEEYWSEYESEYVNFWKNYYIKKDEDESELTEKKLPTVDLLKETQNALILTALQDIPEALGEFLSLTCHEINFIQDEVLKLTLDQSIVEQLGLSNQNETHWWHDEYRDFLNEDNNDISMTKHSFLIIELTKSLVFNRENSDYYFNVDEILKKINGESSNNDNNTIIEDGLLDTQLNNLSIENTEDDTIKDVIFVTRSLLLLQFINNIWMLFPDALQTIIVEQ
eukprot:TRINITY_DN552_c0_g6_i1.p2 TRINITY_DN552_c0_g6~~TRINITY_DN552_c0_g6_i1.p2  ORF type:complete len:259 (-),score=67.78 TRINITY_DN552_c0_g6_i1:1125-1901(-)